jgi:glycolate dehydrogenase iron-sulfur subunit
MRTNFSSAQLADPELADAAAIVSSCMHLGFCTNTCPTYVLTRDENDSPRGRIDLIHAMLEKGGPPEPRTVYHLDRCLSCLSCMSTCAVKVDYVHLIDHARVHIQRHYRRPIADRLIRYLLARILPRPRLFAAVLILGRALKPAGAFLPGRLSAMLDLVPRGNKLRPEILAPQVFRAEGPRRKRVALLAGCAQQALDGNINAATIRLLRRHGCEVVVPAGAQCCGSLTLHMGRDHDAKAAARENIAAWTREVVGEGLDAIVINASGCGTTVKDYGHLFAHDSEWAARARSIAGLARDITELMDDLGLQPGRKAHRCRITYHDPCSIQHGQRITEQPRRLLKDAGFVVADVPERHFCCGSAGTYNLLQPALADELGRRKARHIASTDPDVVATGNIGCMMQLRRHLSQPILHTVELLDWATGGPMPPALDGVRLRELSEPAPAAEQSEKSELGFW